MGIRLVSARAMRHTMRVDGWYVTMVPRYECAAQAVAFPQYMKV